MLIILVIHLLYRKINSFDGIVIWNSLIAQVWATNPAKKHLFSAIRNTEFSLASW